MASPISRRQLLKTAALSGLLGLGVNRSMRAAADSVQCTETSCVFVFLFGGQSHLDLWDMKPAAPREVRGEFYPISTSVPGIQICEHLPELAQQMSRFSLIRSMTHKMPVHGPACSEVYSGREYFGPPTTDQALPQDWPSLASLVERFVPNSTSGIPPSVVLPWYTQFVGQDKIIAGQTGGRMGSRFDPFLIEGNPVESEFEIHGLKPLNELNTPRLQQRQRLVSVLESKFGQQFLNSARGQLLERQYRQAFQLISDQRLFEASELSRESDATRDRYGRTRFGQSMLLARRLVESGTRLVTVNWDDDHKDDKVSPHWDTHVENFPKLKARLCPPFDRALATFLQDLDQRGLLEKTLVVALGEFGRTPKVGAISQNNMTESSGRDHWPHAFTALIAGGKLGGGKMYGKTTSNGGYVDSDPVHPADLTATILQHLGIEPTLEYDDEFTQQKQRLCEGSPLVSLG